VDDSFPQEHRNSIWIYASTIGELNAVEPFLLNLLRDMGSPRTVLLTDRPLYRESYRSKYPDAEIIVLGGDVAAILSRRSLPRLLLMAEIPCLLSDAPCRFPFAFAYALKRRGVPLCLVNGWLYHGSPSCRIDAIERWLLGRDYVRLFDLITVQDEETRSVLITSGADHRRVFVTGNTKFDALNVETWTLSQARSPRMLQSMMSGSRPSIVAGCVTNISEQELVLDSFKDLLQHVPQALLVIAPRHPEVSERMVKLRALMRERRLSYVFRTEVGDDVIREPVNCLVLDTIGELRDFYAACTIAYVGLNHNVLEPIVYGKPVVVTPGWERTYPSYPVYKRLVSERVILEVEPAELKSTWRDLLGDPAVYAAHGREGHRTLESLKGATARNMELFREMGLSGALNSTRKVQGNRGANCDEALWL